MTGVASVMAVVKIALVAKDLRIDRCSRVI